MLELDWETSKSAHVAEAQKNFIQEVKKFPEVMHEIIFATNRSRNANYYLKGNPVALVAQNLPSYMGGMANPWASNPNSIMLQTKLGIDVAPETFNFKESN